MRYVDDPNNKLFKVHKNLAYCILRRCADEYWDLIKTKKGPGDYVWFEQFFDCSSRSGVKLYVQHWLDACHPMVEITQEDENMMYKFFNV